MSSSPPNPSDIYPAPLKTAEKTLIDQRRQRARTAPGAQIVGLALSGGGIRSATFALGFIQALAQRGLFRQVDVLSTASGGGYCGAFVGAAYSRPNATTETVERDLADNNSWPITWLRDNGRYLSPNGSGDNWMTAAIVVRNWIALHVVLLTFGLLVLSLGSLIRADLGSTSFTASWWNSIELFCWRHRTEIFWWSPWLVLPAIPFVFVMVPSGSLYWLTQLRPFMHAVRRTAGMISTATRTMSDAELAMRTQNTLTHLLMFGLVATVVLGGIAGLDSLGQSAYWHWADRHFSFPALWTALTSIGAAGFGLGSKVVVYLERLLGSRKGRLPLNIIALALAFVWLALILVGLAVIVCGVAWQWRPVHVDENLVAMPGDWALLIAVGAAFFASWFFSRSFSFVNLSSLQQVYAARLARAYLGATNPERQRSSTYTMTTLVPGDDLAMEEYAPHVNGGPLHLISVTVNETLSGKTQLERRDRKGLNLAIGPAGLSVGVHSHALWASHDATTPASYTGQALWDVRQRTIAPIDFPGGGHQVFSGGNAEGTMPTQRIEALSLRQWVAISGASFTTGSGATTCVGLSLLLGLANVRLGYWWNSGLPSAQQSGATPPNFLELGSRLLSRIMPVQTCLMTEFFARFHGPARRHWYLSDGGHFDNSACYELIRRRVPFIIYSDAGHDPSYELTDLSNLIRKARLDLGAEIQILRRANAEATDDPGLGFPLPALEQVVHPTLLEIIGAPEDFAPLQKSDGTPSGERGPAPSMRHALLARIHYPDTHEFSWMLIAKPSLTGDETQDVIQYQQTRDSFPQEPTSDQYFDEAQWESYRKLGEHIGLELFTPAQPVTENGAPSWSPSLMQPPDITAQRTIIESRTPPLTPKR